MARGLKPETEIRNLRRELKRTENWLKRAEHERDAYRARATQAEQQAADWRRRFDELLKIFPPGKAGQ